MARWAAAQGIDYVDGAIVGFPSAIGTADAIIFYAGSETAIAVGAAVIVDLSGTPMHVGDDAGHPAIIDGALTWTPWRSSSPTWSVGPCAIRRALRLRLGPWWEG